MNFHIYGEIGYNHLEAVSALRSEDQVIICSPGGNVDAMLSLFDLIQRAGCDTVATGIVQSAAAVLVQAGRVRKMTENALLRFHDVIQGSYCKILSQHLRRMVKNRRSPEFADDGKIVDRLFSSGAFISAQEAFRFGLIEEIICPEVQPVAAR